MNSFLSPHSILVALLILSPTGAGAAGCGGTLDDSSKTLIAKLIEGGLLSPKDAGLTIGTYTAEIVGSHHLWDVERGTVEFVIDRFKTNGRIVYRASGQPLMILNFGLRPKELLPTQGSRVTVEADGVRYVPTADSTWRPLYRASAGRGEPPHHSKIRASVNGDPVEILIKDPGGAEKWTFTTNGTSRFALRVDDVVELADGRRYVRESSGLRPVPGVGRGRILATTAKSRNVRESLGLVHHLIDARGLDRDFPPTPEIHAAEHMTAIQSRSSRGLLHAILGPPRGEDGERWVLLIDPERREFVFPNYPGEMGPKVQLQNGQYLFKRDFKYYLRDQGVAPLDPQDREPLRPAHDTP